MLKVGGASSQDVVQVDKVQVMTHINEPLEGLGSIS